MIDHRPLKGLFGTSLDKVDNCCIQGDLEKLRVYYFNVEWVAGQTHLIADALSRSPDARADGTIYNPAGVNVAVATVTGRWESDMEEQVSVLALARGVAHLRLPRTPLRPLKKVAQEDVGMFQRHAVGDAKYQTLLAVLQSGANRQRLLLRRHFA